MNYVSYILIAMLFSSSLFGGNGGRTISQEATEFFSFENDMEGWTTNATDLELAGGLIDWSITRSQEMTKDGNTSLRFYLQNDNDMGKVWIEKPFAVESNQIYQVSIEYELASRDYEDSNFGLITGILKKQPRTRDDLIPAYQDDARNGSNTDKGYRWINKRYEFTVRSDEERVLHAVIGIVGNFEAGGIYYVDSVRVTLSKKPEGSQFYSFENDLEGWTPRGTDLESGTGSIGWSITRSEEIWDDGKTSVKFDLDNLNSKGKIWIEKAVVVEPRNIYRAIIDFSFASRFRSDPKFNFITGILRHSPETGEDLEPAYQGDADNAGHPVWLHKGYEFKVKSKKARVLYVVIGISGTAQAHRTYWFDNVCIILTKQ